MRAALRIETAWGCSTMVQRLFLYRDLDLIECRASVNWQEQHKMLKLAFPLRLDAPRATYDAAYGCIERACNGEEEPGQQWVDVSGRAHLGRRRAPGVWREPAERLQVRFRRTGTPS